MAIPQLRSFDIQPALSAFDTSRDRAIEDQKRQTLSEIGGQMAEGNLSGAANAAYRSGNIDAGLKIQGAQQDQQTEALSILAKHAAAADTPEKWQRYTDFVHSRIPNANLPGFDQRDAVLAEFKQAVEPMSVSPGATIIDKNNPGGGALFSAPPAPPKPLQLQAADKKAIFESEDESAALQGTLDALKRAEELNGTTDPKTGKFVPGKVFSGVYAKQKAWAGSNLPDWMVPDSFAGKEDANATREFTQIMSKEAIQAMSASLKGATTDFELRKFEEILSDPTTPPEIRANTIKRIKTLTERKLKINAERAKDLRAGTYYQPGGGQDVPDPNAMNATETIQGDQGDAVEGDIAEDANGNQIILRGGQWEPL